MLLREEFGAAVNHKPFEQVNCKELEEVLPKTYPSSQDTIPLSADELKNVEWSIVIIMFVWNYNRGKI